MKAASLSDTGLLREKNEDSCLVCENSNGDFLAMVADGIGGSNAGEVASFMACEYMKKAILSAPVFHLESETRSFLEKILISLNEYIYEESLKNPDYYQMGTTVTGIFIWKDYAEVFNVGDSRVYCFLNHELVCLTEDDTLVRELVKRNEISEEEALVHPKRHVLIRAIGNCYMSKPQIVTVDRKGRFLLCSDGLHGYVSEREIKEILEKEKQVEFACRRLVEAALMKGGYDNITVVLAENE